MTPEDVNARFRHAARTIRVNYPSDGPQEYGSSWPDVVMDAKDAYGTGMVDFYAVTKTRPAKASPQDITQAEEAMSWAINWLNSTERILVWYWAARRPMAVIAKRLHIDKSTAWRWKKRAVEKISNRLQEKPPGLPK